VKAPGFKPLNLSSGKTGFQNLLLFKFNLYRYAAAMGLPVSKLVAATNANAAAHGALRDGVWARRALVSTPSTAGLYKLNPTS
jgi:hypothetical protein